MILEAPTAAAHPCPLGTIEMQLQQLIQDGSAVLTGSGFALVFYAYVRRLEDRLGEERGATRQQRLKAAPSWWPTRS